MMSNPTDDNFKTLISHIFKKGVRKGDRTGTGTLSVFGYQMRFDMQDGFPMSTLKKVYWKNPVHELLWMMGAMDESYDKFGNTNIRYLVDNKVNIWNEWPFVKWLKDNDRKKPMQGSDEWNYLLRIYLESIKNNDEFALKWGDLGPVYGKQWVKWGSNPNATIAERNQLFKALYDLIYNPESRRIIVSAWNPEDISQMALPPCHAFYQFCTSPLSEEERMMTGKKYKLDLQLYQRSADLFLGVFSNVPFYSLLLHMFAQITDMVPGEFVWTGGDVHMYLNSLDACEELIKRDSRPTPDLLLTKPEPVSHRDPMSYKYYRAEHIQLIGYDPHPNIKVDVAI